MIATAKKENTGITEINGSSGMVAVVVMGLAEVMVEILTQAVIQARIKALIPKIKR